jgi:hypothetical protein
MPALTSTHRSRWCSAVLLLCFAAGYATTAADQARQAPQDCTQPMAQPITEIAVQGISLHPTPTRDGCWLFAGFVDREGVEGGSGIAALRRTGDTFEEVHTVLLPLPRGPANGVPMGMRLTPDEKVLVVSHSRWITFLDVEKLKAGEDPMLGQVEGPRIAVSWGLTLSEDGTYAFAAQQRTALVAMIDLERARTPNGAKEPFTGFVPTSPSPINLAVSPDGRHLYVVNRIAPDVIEVPRSCEGGTGLEGVVQVIDVERARTDPASATVGFASPAGCGPQNVALSPDGTRLSATAGGRLVPPPTPPADTAVVIFDTRPLQEGRMPVPVGRIPMPAPPVIIHDTGDRIVVGFFYLDANDTSANLVVIDPSKAAEGRAAIVGNLPFPALYLTASFDGRTLYASRPGVLSVVDLERAQLKR